MKRLRYILRGVAAGTLVGIAVYAVSAGDWLRALALAALLVLVGGCAAPAPPVASCPPLPMPFGTTRAARDAYVLLVIDLYGRCAAQR